MRPPRSLTGENILAVASIPTPDQMASPEAHERQRAFVAGHRTTG
jgi:hypothetical protein